MEQRKLYQELASCLTAAANCLVSGNAEWLGRHKDRAERLVRDMMPSGSGFDNGTTLDFDKSNGNRLVFVTAFHHMNDGGMYDGWTEHTVTVTPSFVGGFDLRVSGRDRNDIKDYIGDSFQHALSQDVPDWNAVEV
jgi:hypothetical protein